MHIDAFPYTMAYLGSRTLLNNAVSESEALMARGAESDLCQYSQMTKEQLSKSKSSYEKLITEHQQKLSDYIKNPDVYDNKGLLKNVSLDIRKKSLVDV